MNNWIDDHEDLALCIVLGVFQVCFWAGVWYIVSSLYCAVTQ